MQPILPITLCAALMFGLTDPGRLQAAPRQAAARCMTVFTQGEGPLVNIDGAVGFAPAAVTLGNVRGLLSSVVTAFEASGSEGQGAQHLTLVHTFVSTDAARPGTLTTQDRAVCAPAGSDPAVCRVNDALAVVAGTGVFAHATGSLRNHGVIDFTSFTLTFSIRGRLCGDGL